MSQMDKTAQEQDAPTTEKENNCRDLQRKLGPSSAFETQQELYRERLDRIYRNFIASSFESILRQPDTYSFFVLNKYASDVVICHTIPEYYNRFSDPRSRQMIKASNTRGILRLRRPTIWQNIPGLLVKAPTLSVDISPMCLAASQTFPVTTLPGFKQARTQG